MSRLGRQSNARVGPARGQVELNCLGCRRHPVCAGTGLSGRSTGASHVGDKLEESRRLVAKQKADEEAAAATKRLQEIGENQSWLATITELVSGCSVCQWAAFGTAGSIRCTVAATASHGSISGFATSHSARSATKRALHKKGTLVVKRPAPLSDGQHFTMPRGIGYGGAAKGSARLLLTWFQPIDAPDCNY